MPSSNLVYMPTFRARQQEMIVLRSFDFGTKMYPLIEIIKEKERSSHPQTFQEIYAGLADAICSDKVFVDLPVYLREASGMQDEVVSFNRTVLSDIVKRIEHYNLFGGFKSQMQLLGLGLLIGWRIQVTNATFRSWFINWLKTWFGVSKLSLFLGLLFSSFSTKLIYSSMMVSKFVFLGIYWRTKPLRFSFAPLSQLW